MFHTEVGISMITSILSTYAFYTVKEIIFFTLSVFYIFIGVKKRDNDKKIKKLFSVYYTKMVHMDDDMLGKRRSKSKSMKKSMKSKSKKSMMKSKSKSDCKGVYVLRKIKGRKNRVGYCLEKSALKKMSKGGKKGGKRSHKKRRSSKGKKRSMK